MEVYEIKKFNDPKTDYDSIWNDYVVEIEKMYCATLAKLLRESNIEIIGVLSQAIRAYSDALNRKDEPTIVTTTIKFLKEVEGK